MPLVITAPAVCECEQGYVLSVVLRDWLGLEFTVRYDDRRDYRVHLEGGPGEISLPASFFNAAAQAWLEPGSMPRFPLLMWDSSEAFPDAPLTDPIVPILFGEDSFALSTARTGSSHRLRLPVDVFGSVFFLLSRYEEAIVENQDTHDRFPSQASAAVKGRFLDRPLADEYVELLFAAMSAIWPSLRRQLPEPVVRVTCDVDSLHRLDCSMSATARGLVADLFKHRSTRRARENLSTRLRVRSGNLAQEEDWLNLYWMMEVAEKYRRVMTFFFLVDRHSVLDATYRIDSPVVRLLLREIHARGHHIGLHARYTTYLSAARTQREADKLRSVLKQEAIDEPMLCSRQHYLRWHTPTTAENLESAGVACDSSLSFADRAGFRCGTSRDYRMYNVRSRRELRLLQRPLILMECSVVEPNYMGMGFKAEALACMRGLKASSLAIGRQFTMLWHNSYFHCDEAYRFFLDLVSQ